MNYFLRVIGMLFIIEGLPYLVFPEKLKTYLAKITAMPESTLRIMGICAVAVGLILLYFGRR